MDRVTNAARIAECAGLAGIASVCTAFQTKNYRGCERGLILWGGKLITKVMAMKKKRKTFYDVSIPGKWWCGRKIGWVEDLSSTQYKTACSSRNFRTAKRAVAHASGCEPGTVLLQWGFKRGKRTLKEYVRV